MSTKKTYTGGDPKHEAPDYKGQVRQNHQKGAPGVSKKNTGKHEKDQSSGAERNTTKKQGNSV